MHQLLWETWEDFRDDDSLDVAILTGAGDAFCAGADLKTYIPPIIEAPTPRWVRDNVATGLGGLTRGLHRIYKPVIAAVNGWALAGGFETALACDIRIASERAMFGSFEVRRGYHHGDGGIVRLVNTCGAGIALEMLLTGEPIDAQRALQCNLVVAGGAARRPDGGGRADGAPDPAQQPDRRALGEGDDPRRDRPAARRAAADRGAERLHRRRTPRRRWRCSARFYDKTDAGRAGEHETAL